MSNNTTTDETIISTSIPTSGSGITETESNILKAFSLLMMILFPFGLYINIMSLVTLCKVSMKTATENIFIGLTFADTLSNVSGTMTNLIITLSYFTSVGKDPFLAKNFKYFLRADVVLYFFSFIITATLSIERVFAVFKSNDFRKIWTPFCGIVTLLIGCGSTLIVCILIVSLISENALLLFRIVFSMTCIVVVVLANILTVYGLKSKLSAVVPMNQTSQSITVARERRQTKILVVISVLFVISASTNSATALVGMLDSQEFQLSGFIVFLYGYIRWFFQVIYSTLNSIIFVAYNKNYRQRFFNTVFCRK